MDIPRRYQAWRHSLESILLIASPAVICGTDRGIEGELCDRQKQARTEIFLDLHHGPLARHLRAAGFQTAGGLLHASCAVAGMIVHILTTDDTVDMIPFLRVLGNRFGSTAGESAPVVAVELAILDEQPPWGPRSPQPRRLGAAGALHCLHLTAVSRAQPEQAGLSSRAEPRSRAQTRINET